MNTLEIFGAVFLFLLSLGLLFSIILFVRFIFGLNEHVTDIAHNQVSFKRDLGEVTYMIKETRDELKLKQDKRK